MATAPVACKVWTQSDLPHGDVRWTPRLMAFGPVILGWAATLTAWNQERWILGTLQATVFVFALAAAQRALWTGRRLERSWTALLAGLMALLGVVQILTGTTVYEYATREASLQWLVMAAAAFLARNASIWPSERKLILKGLICLAAICGVLAVGGIVRPSTLILGIFESNSPEASAFFRSANEYAQFIELALPVILYRAFWDRQRWIWYALVAAILVGTVIGFRARMGSAIVLLELGAVLWLARRQRLMSGRRWRILTVSLTVLSLALAAAIGAGGLWDRLSTESLVEGRDSIMRSTLELIRHGSIAGYGLGTFPYVFPAWSSGSFFGFVNHAHNDYLEALSEGGAVLAVLLITTLGRMIPASRRHGWGIGVIAIAIHAMVDFPLHRMSIAMWTFTLMGLLESAVAGESSSPLLPSAPSSEAELEISIDEAAAPAAR